MAVSIPLTSVIPCCGVVVAIILVCVAGLKIVRSLSPKSNYVEFPLDEENYPPMKGMR